MKSLLKSLIFTAAVLSSVGAYAKPLNDDGGHVGGGDKRCAEFYDIATTIALSLVKTGQSKIDQTNSLIVAAEVWARVKKLKVLPARNLDRQAITDFVKMETQLDVKQWDQIPTYMGKIRLVAHELMVLTEAETDGMYVVSQDLILVYLNTKQSLQAKSSSYQTNPDGSVTVFEPYFVLVGNQTTPDVVSYIYGGSSALGVCKYLGFSNVINHNGSHYEFKGSIAVDSGGRFLKRMNIYTENVYATITCI